MNKRICVIGVAAIALATLSGCGMVTVKDAGPSIERTAVEAAVVVILENSSQPAKRAAEVVESVDKLQSLLTDEQVTVVDLRSALLKRIKERDLSPGEKALALSVITRIADNVEVKIGAGHLSRESIVSVEQVLGWAEEYAALYVQN